MCGIAGVFKPGGVDQGDVELVRAMNTVQAHRGPDADGIHKYATCVLGHRRLAIIDLSVDGRQPFSSPCERYHIVFNGEIYNYIELRRELEDAGRVFRTKTDTEVLLAAYLHWGVNCLHRLNGMFAFAVHDVVAQTLFLARDRFGVKPLYYVRLNGLFAFASEIKALLKVPGLSRAPDMRSMFDYLVFHRTDIHEETFFRHIRRVVKGSHALVDMNGYREVSWWAPQNYLSKGDIENLDGVCRHVEELLVSAVELRMRSDVPVGSCLSGGLDSSVLLGILYDKLNATPSFKCFTEIFPDTPVDESCFVDKLQKRFPFVSLRSTATGTQVFDDFAEFVWHNDEPTSGPSFYAQYDVMRLVKKNGVVVLLDGQGGDESFAGYQYFHGFHLFGILKNEGIWKFAQELIHVLSRNQDMSAFSTLAFQTLPAPVREFLLYRSSPVGYEFFREHAFDSVILNEFFGARSLNESLVQHFNYKLEHLLRTEDRNSMAFSLETRLPYLDFRLVEFLLGLPEKYKIQSGHTKWLQKKSVGKYSIPEITNRKDKLGFATPEAAWMSEPRWKEMIEESLAFLRSEFPGVLRKGMGMNARLQWKICSLALWRKQCLS